MLYQSLWCLHLPEGSALPLFQRLRDACRRATQQHPRLGVALLFSGSTTWLLAEGDAAGLAQVGTVLQGLGLGLGLNLAPEAVPAPTASASATASSPGPARPAHAVKADTAAAAPGPGGRDLMPGQCHVGYLDGDDPGAGPLTAGASPAHAVAAFWGLWRSADRG